MFAACNNSEVERHLPIGGSKGIASDRYRDRSFALRLEHFLASNETPLAKFDFYGRSNDVLSHIDKGTRSQGVTREKAIPTVQSAPEACRHGRECRPNSRRCVPVAIRRASSPDERRVERQSWGTADRRAARRSEASPLVRSRSRTRQTCGMDGRPLP